jgi:hypothetical protein
MKIDIENKDFEKLLFKVNLLKDNENPFNMFPALIKWPEFSSYKGPMIKFNRIFKWIVLTYDLNSPFKKIDNVIQRKIEVAKYVNLIDGPKINEDIKEIFLNENSEVNAMIIAYARMHRESKYSLIIGLEHKFYEDLLANQNRKKISTPLEQSQKNLENAITELLSKDNNTNLMKSFYEYIEDERLDNIRPEGIARLIKEGKQPILEEEIEDE